MTTILIREQIAMGLKERQAEIIEFFNKEHDKLVGYIRSKVASISEMDIEDLLQDLLINLFNKADITGHIENLTAYIYRSVHNRIIDQLRRNKKTVSLDDDTNNGGKTLSDLLFDPEYDIYKEITKKEFREKLFKAVDSLEPKQRAVWIATEMEGYSFRELSEMWAEPIGTLLSRKHRAVQALQNALREYKTEMQEK